MAIQALSVIDSSRPCELDVHMVMDGAFGSSLNGHANLLDSGHNHGKEQRSGTP